MSVVKDKTALLNLATTKQVETIRTEFNKDQLNEMREMVTDFLIKINTKEDELSDIKDKYKAEINPMKKQNKMLLTDIRAGFRDEEMEVYLIPDYDSKTMELYNEDGDLVGKRKMFMAELQMKLI